MEHGTGNKPWFVLENAIFVGGELMVCAGIYLVGRTDLYIIRNRVLTGRQYRDEILRLLIVFYASAIGDNIVLIDVNFRLHNVNL